MTKLNVLYIYSCGEFPPRKTVSSFINCFKKYSEHRIFYHNISFSNIPKWFQKVDFDLVIFSHFVTTPWNRTRYIKKIEQYEKIDFGNAKKIAFFQDEYCNTDLIAEFIDRVGIQEVYTVAPTSEISIIYGKVKNKSVSYRSYLTGYVDEEDLKYFDTEEKRTIDLSYRTGWPSIEMFRLGKFGSLKYRIAEEFEKHSTDLKTDIKIGQDVKRGLEWFRFIKRSRYMLGVESGASLLDETGSIYDKIKEFHAKTKSTIFEDYEQNCFPGLDGSLNLKAISPRVFEAAMAKTGLVMIEGHYNGILTPDVHYLAVKNDFSNIADIVKKLDDEKIRKSLTENSYSDLIASRKYSYRTFVQNFFAEYENKKEKSGNLFLYFNRAQDICSWLKVIVWTLIPRAVKKIVLKV